MTTMRDAFVQAATRALDASEDVCIILADIGNAQFRESGAVERHPDRLINVGIREQLMIGVASGMALEGFRPIVHTYAPFLVERPYEQIKLDLAHQGAGAVLVSIGASYDAAAAGRTHQAPEDVALMYTVPGSTVYVPGHPAEVEAALTKAINQDGLVYIRLSDESNDKAFLDGIDGISVIRRGSPESPTVLAVGPALQAVLSGCADLDLTVLYTASPRPLKTLNEDVTGVDVFLVEPYLKGTTAADLARALSNKPHRFHDLGVSAEELRRYGTGDEHRHAHGLDAEGIRSRLLLYQSGDVGSDGEA